MLSPVKCAFTAGCRTSAAATSFVRRSLTVGFVSPSRSRATSASRTARTAVMSALTWSWKTGASQASVSRRAIVFRVDESSIVLRLAGRGERGRSGGCGGRGSRRGRGLLDVLGDDPSLRAGARRSAPRSRPFSRAIRRASGEALTRPSVPPVAAGARSSARPAPPRRVPRRARARALAPRPASLRSRARRRCPTRPAPPSSPPPCRSRRSCCRRRPRPRRRRS